jgi:hypothetical protein
MSDNIENMLENIATEFNNDISNIENGKFVFDPLDEKEIKELYEKSPKFYVSVKDIKDICITENKFHTESYGDCHEHIDMYVVTDDGIKSVVFSSIGDLRRHFVVELDSGSGRFDLEEIYKTTSKELGNVKSIFIIMRTMSSFVFDKVIKSCRSVEYIICSDEISKFFADNADIAGLVGRHHIPVGEEYITDIIKGLSNLHESQKISDTMYDEYITLLEKM